MPDAPRILCCGEALIDMLPRRTDEGVIAFQPFAGGAVFNTAIALGRLECSAGLLTGLSTDLFGRVLTEELAASGADASLCVLSDRPTTLAFVELTDGHARYAFYDENTAGRLLAESDLPVLPKATEVLFFGGISLVAESCGSTYETLALREAGSRVIVLDPNIRPGFIRDEPAYRNRIRRMIAASDIVKLSDEDLVWLNGEGDLGTAARAIIAEGPRLVCITQGADGAHAFTSDLHLCLPAPEVTVADTVGAGDTFNAGLIASLDAAGRLTRQGLDRLDDKALRDALTLAMKAAAVTVSRAGANPPRLSELG